MDAFEKCRRFDRAEELRRAGLYPYFMPIAESLTEAVVIDGRRFIMIGSNNYLGLTHHPKVKQAAIDAVTKYGTGCTGSRVLNGTLDLHVELERRLARFFRMGHTPGSLKVPPATIDVPGSREFPFTLDLRHPPAG